MSQGTGPKIRIMSEQSGRVSGRGRGEAERSFRMQKEGIMRRSWTDQILWGMAAIVLAMTAALCIVGSIRSQAADTQKVREAYYEQSEREYLSRVREFMEEQGYRNSGITLNRVVDSDGQRSYKVLVHHGALDRLEEAAQEEVLRQIEDLGFQDADCIFTARILR